MESTNLTENLRKVLDLFHPVDSYALCALTDAVTPKTYRRMQYVIQQDQPAPDFIFIFSGLYRMAHITGNTEDTLCFITENTPMASPQALYDGGRANLSVQAIIPGEGAVLPLERWQELRSQFPALSKCYERMLEKQIFDLERRYLYFSSSDIDERYSTFMKVRPNFTNKIPLKYIAQYLGVTPETISRVRARLKDIPNS